jgi:phosphoribosyl 1,2-cyclic phosphate phosphodiesterase
MAKITFLGTGTSSGVPVPGCSCEVCLSPDPRDKRFRTSAFIETPQAGILIDIGPDFRLQALKFGIERIDGVLISHSHQDHIGGIDELRQFNFIMKKHIDIFGNKTALKEIRERFGYIFRKTQEGGGKPLINLIKVKGDFTVNGQPVRPVPVLHGKIPILGYRINSLAYLTDASFISEESIKRISGIKVLVVNALRPRPHPTHFSLPEAVRLAEILKPEKTFLIHLTHKFLHDRDSKALPQGINFAYDGLTVDFE